MYSVYRTRFALCIILISDYFDPSACSLVPLYRLYLPPLRCWTQHLHLREVLVSNM